MVGAAISREIDFGDRLHDLRTQRGWSQMDLARASGVSNVTISNIEGGNAEPKISTLRSLARALDVPFDAFTREQRIVLGQHITKE